MGVCHLFATFGVCEIGHSNVQSCLLLILQTNQIAVLLTECWTANQNWLSVVNASLELSSINKKIVPMLTFPILIPVFICYRYYQQMPTWTWGAALLLQFSPKINVSDCRVIWSLSLQKMAKLNIQAMSISDHHTKWWAVLNIGKQFCKDWGDKTKAVNLWGLWGVIFSLGTKAIRA